MDSLGVGTARPHKKAVARETISARLKRSDDDLTIVWHPFGMHGNLQLRHPRSPRAWRPPANIWQPSRVAQDEELAESERDWKSGL